MEQHTSNMKNSFQENNKPLEIYLFIDPFCTDCWSLTPLIKKLQLEYGDYFTLKYVLCGQLAALNSKRPLDFANIPRLKQRAGNRRIPLQVSSGFDQETFTPHLAALSIKAAELQGKRAGTRFIHRLQELFFMENADISDINIIQQCAKYVNLDMEEFIRDIYSVSVAKAFQCDLKISLEMEVTEMPSLVFFNENIEDEGLKVTGLYSYSIYVQILTEMLEGCPHPSEMPSLEVFLTKNPLIAINDLALIYDQPVKQIECQMKKLQLQQKVKKIRAKNGIFWKYIANTM